MHVMMMKDKFSQPLDVDQSVFARQRSISVGKNKIVKKLSE
jgi:hypothetical protein